MTNAQTTFARVTLEYDKAHERAEAIAEAIFETSGLSDCNAVVVRTAETLLALLAGLRIQLERTKDVPCGVCGQTVVVIGKGAGPHVASLRCASCDRHRGWLPKAIAEFLVATISQFGRPTEAISIRNPEFAQANATTPFGCARGRNVSTLDP